MQRDASLRLKLIGRVDFTDFLVVCFFRATSWDHGTHGGEIGVAVRRELFYCLETIAVQLLLGTATKKYKMPDLSLIHI